MYNWSRNTNKCGVWPDIYRPILGITSIRGWQVCMETIRVLVANEPRSYREAFSFAFRKLRPHISVVTIEPYELDGEVLRLRPDLVLCSELTETVRTCSPSWVLLYPHGDSRAVVSIAGSRTTTTDIQLGDLLSVIDQLQYLARP